MNDKVFRKVALSRLASPEQLDQLLKVTNPKGWLALLGLFLLLGVAVVWGYTGSLETKIFGQGIVVRSGGVLNVVAPASGMVVSLEVHVGDRIRSGQRIGKIAQPVQLQRIRALQDELAEAQRQGGLALQRRETSSQLQVQASERQRANTQRKIAELEAKSKLMSERIPVSEQLLAKGLVTKQAVIDARQKVIDAQDEIATLRAELIQIDAQEFVVKTEPAETGADVQVRVSSLERTLAGLEKELDLSSNVVSPYGGEVIELKASSGVTVAMGSPLLSLQSDKDDLELLVFVPAEQAKETKAGMSVEISPSTMKREEFGFLRGQVEFVSNFPTTPAALMQTFQNESVVGALTNRGPVTEVRVRMIRNARTPSGYQWSSPIGPPALISSGSICTAEIVTREQKPITILFPYMKSRLGLS
jgi:HlyD family secretion protein